MPKSSRSRDSRLARDVMPIAVGVLAIVFSLLLSKVTSTHGYWPVIIGLAFIILVIGIDLCFVGLYVSTTIAANLSDSEQRLADRLSGTDSLVQMLRATIGTAFLKTQAEVMEYERTSVQEQVWILSAGLNDEFAPGISEVVAANLARHVNYLYVIPDDAIIIERVRKIKTGNGDSPHVLWMHMPQEFFDLVPPHDISIYDPLGKTTDQIVGFMNVPARNAPANLFLMLDGNYASGLLRRVLPVAKEHGLIK